MKHTAILILFFLLTACAPAAPQPTPTVDANAAATQAVQTFSAGLTMTAFVPPTETPTNTPEPTATATQEVNKFADIVPVTVDTLDLKHLDTLPEIDAADPFTADMAAQFDNWEKTGQVPNISDQDPSIKGYEMGPNRFQVWPRPTGRDNDIYGAPLAIFASTDDEMSSGDYAAPERRPQRVQAFFRTQVSGKDFVVIRSKFVNQDGSTAIVWYLESFGNFKKNWPKYYSPNLPNSMIAPGYFPDHPQIEQWEADRLYYELYWKSHRDELIAIIDDFQNPQSPNYLKITDKFSTYYWSTISAPMKNPY